MRIAGIIGNSLIGLLGILATVNILLHLQNAPALAIQFALSINGLEILTALLNLIGLVRLRAFRGFMNGLHHGANWLFIAFLVLANAYIYSVWPPLLNAFNGAAALVPAGLLLLVIFNYQMTRIALRDAEE